MIDETAEVPCWLIWVMVASGEVLLRGVDLTEAIAERHRRALEAEPLSVRVYVEPTRANHLYAGLLDARRRTREQRGSGD